METTKRHPGHINRQWSRATCHRDTVYQIQMPLSQQQPLWQCSSHALVVRVIRGSNKQHEICLESGMLAYVVACDDSFVLLSAPCRHQSALLNG